MNHKAWIKNYERNFEKLAEEVGDLRYDTLFEFLDLLSQKIKKDGQKDKSRGRLKLAGSLQAASQYLKKSAEEIEKAWLISEPYMFPKDITQKIRAEFEKGELKTVFKLISDYYRGWEEDITFRLARCLLYETNGSLEKLKENIKYANQDYRDIIMQAEYDGNRNWLRNFNRPFGEEKIRPEDLESNKYVPSDSDDLPF